MSDLMPEEHSTASDKFNRELPSRSGSMSPDKPFDSGDEIDTYQLEDEESSSEASEQTTNREERGKQATGRRGEQATGRGEAIQ